MSKIRSKKSYFKYPRPSTSKISAITTIKNFLCKTLPGVFIFAEQVNKQSNMPKEKRKKIDCRLFPNEIGCTLTISGNKKEVLKAALRHAVEEHGHQDTPELRRQIKALMENEK